VRLLVYESVIYAEICNVFCGNMQCFLRQYAMFFAVICNVFCGDAHRYV